ncbi:MAG: polysaccharide deacetylase family protein [Phycisphaerae bacterium]|nr:polysaccharide deacetylase family protein [Phycisphaerae bacterium]
MKAVLILALVYSGVLARLAGAEQAEKAEEAYELSSVQLGWPADAKVLMIHGDDIGMCNAANEAAKQALVDGRITSCSIMMPCPWAYDFCMWVKDKQDQYDIGLHITLTSEWKTYRWGPVLPPSEVPSLCDKEGFLWDDVLPVVLRAKADEIEREIRAQVELAIKWGIRPTHLDTHMGTVFGRPDFTMAFMKVAREFGITPFLIEPSPFFIKEARTRGLPVTPQMIKLLKDFPSAKLDNFTYPQIKGISSYEDRKATLMEQIRKLEPGVTCLIIHPSILTPELEAITGSAKTRAWELKVFDDPDVRKLIKDEKIHLVTWRELAKRRPMPQPTTTPTAKTETPSAK